MPALNNALLIGYRSAWKKAHLDNDPRPVREIERQ